MKILLRTADGLEDTVEVLGISRVYNRPIVRPMAHYELSSEYFIPQEMTAMRSYQWSSNRVSDGMPIYEEIYYEAGSY